MLRYALYRLQLAHAVGECILRRGGSDALFPTDFGEELSNLNIYFACLPDADDVFKYITYNFHELTHLRVYELTTSNLQLGTSRDIHELSSELIS